jgi:hypothetical protein
MSQLPDPASKPLRQKTDGQEVEQHSLSERIAWEKHQAEKASGGGFAALRVGQVRPGGPNDGAHSK